MIKELHTGQNVLIVLDLCQPHYLSSLVDNLSEGLHNNKCEDCKSYLD